ncbi:phage major capsid protein [Actinoallomurus sp. CA-142502]|uniref:phage major capsid protein n=1 Tax=Actinoallomurus sp. CA-142502 TaxID=3239885 RepID=UPI003D94129B
MLEFLRQQLAELLTKRAALKTELDAVLAKPTEEKRNLTDEETKTFGEKRDAIKALDTDAEGLQARIAELEEIEQRSEKANELQAKYGQDKPGTEARRASGVKVTREPLTYERGNGHSYFLDLAKAQLRNDAGAAERLQRHAAELDVEMPAREARRRERAENEMRGLDAELRARGEIRNGQASAFEKRVNPNRTDGQGGYFVPPLWLIDEYVDLPRFGRAFANTVRNMQLPAGTDSINVPKIATGTATGVQTADAGNVTSQDMTDTFVSANVRTIAGQQDVAIQLLDQSPASFDEIVFADLIADYNMRLDTQCLNGSGSSGQLLGVLNVSGINAVTYTDASPTLPLMYPPLMKSLSQVAKNRKMMPSAVFMTPSRWFWAASQLDSQNRPLILPETNAPFNPLALQTGGDVEGPVGRLLNFPIIADGNIPTNLGAGTNEERIITTRTSDLYLWEGSMRTRVLQEVLSGTLQVRFQVYNYAAFMPNRRPEAISVISGTGVIAPTGF